MHAGGLGSPQTQPAIADANLERVAQRSDGQKTNLFAFQQAHFHEALRNRIVTNQSFDQCTLPLSKLVE